MFREGGPSMGDMAFRAGVEKKVPLAAESGENEKKQKEIEVKKPAIFQDPVTGNLKARFVNGHTARVARAFTHSPEGLHSKLTEGYREGHEEVEEGELDATDDVRDQAEVADIGQTVEHVLSNVLREMATDVYVLQEEIGPRGETAEPGMDTDFAMTNNVDTAGRLKYVIAQSAGPRVEQLLSNPPADSAFDAAGAFKIKQRYTVDNHKGFIAQYYREDTEETTEIMFLYAADGITAENDDEEIEDEAA